MKRIFVFLATLLFANNSFSQKIEIVFPMEYDSIRLLTTSVLKLYKNGENSFLDMQSGIQLKNFDDGEFLGFSNGLGIVKKREKYFYVDSTGKRTSKKYDVLSWMNSEGIGYAKKGKKEYLLGKKDEILFQTKNGEIISYNENFVVVAQDGKKLVLDFEGEKIIPFDITHLIKIDDGNYWVFNTEKKRWGIIKTEKGFVRFPDFDELQKIESSLFYFEKGSEKGFFSMEQEVLASFDSYERKNDLFYLKKGGKWAIANLKGILQTEYVFDKIEPFYHYGDRLNIAVKDGKKGVVNARGESLVDFAWEEIEGVEMRWIKAKTDDKISIIDTTGTTLVEGNYLSVYPISDSLFRARDTNKKFGVVGKGNNIVVPFEYQYIKEFHNGIAQAEKRKTIDGVTNIKYGYVSLKGDFIDMKALSRSEFRKGYGIAHRDSTFYAIDSTFKTIIPYEKQFTGIKGPSEGLFLVKNNGLFGYFNTKGDKVIDFQFKSAGLFENGLAKVDMNKYINKKGEVVSRINFNQKLEVVHGLFAVAKNGKWGFVDHDDKQLTPYKYDFVDYFPKRYALVQKNNKKGLVDGKGKEVAPPIYERIEALNENAGDPYDLILLENNGKGTLLLLKESKEIERMGFDDIKPVQPESQVSKKYFVVEEKGRFGVITIINSKF